MNILNYSRKQLDDYFQQKYGMVLQVARMDIQITSATKKTYQWPNDLVFQGKRLVYISALTLDDLEETLEGNDLISDDNFINGLVTLVDDKKKEIIQREPLVSFNPRLNDGRLYTLNNVLPITNQCLLEFTPGTTLTANTVASFQVGYLEDDMVMISKRELLMLEERNGQNR